jgi:glycerophosphoryl diester phosphodiesterase
MSAFKRAIDGQSDMIEMDIRETKDGLIAVIHDGKVDRTSNGTGEVKKFTFAELRKLDAGSWFNPAFAHEKIPSLDEFLELVKGTLIPMIEIKDSFKKSPKLSASLIEKLKDHKMLNDVIVAVTGKSRWFELSKLAPELPVAVVSFTGFQARSLAKIQGLAGLDHYWKSLSAKLIKDIHEAGLFITPWTINKRSDMLRCLRLGAECILTDSPLLLRDTIEEYEVLRVSEPFHTETLEPSEDELESLNTEELTQQRRAEE